MVSYYARIRSDKSGFSVDFPDLPGCFTCGETREEAIEMAHDVLPTWLSILEDESLEIPEPSSLDTLESDDTLRKNEDDGSELIIEFVRVEGLFACPCCGEYTLEKPDVSRICQNCGWEDDVYQKRHPNYAGGANDMSLNEAREAYKRGEEVE